MTRTHFSTALSAALVLVAAAASAQDAGTAQPEPRTIDASSLRTELKAKGKKQPLLIDVRSAEEFRAEHIPTAVNIPFKDDPRAFVDALPKDARKRPLRMYCNGVT